MGKKGPYIDRDIWIEGEKIRIYGEIIDPIRNYGEIWANVTMNLFFECPGQIYKKCFYPYWITGPVMKLIKWVHLPGERYPRRGSYEFTFKARTRRQIWKDKPCNITSAQKWRAIVWYGPVPLNWYRNICERGGSWREFVNHPRCLGMLEWTVLSKTVLLPAATIPPVAVSSIILYHELTKRK